jgi:precorrin-3B synthase
MPSGDGILVRLHFSCGIVTSDQARAIAALAQRYGNGLIDLTRRANLQIRGVAPEQIAELQAKLLAKSLIPQDAEGETPNVIASPLTACDREAVIDIRPLVRKLEARLTADLRAGDLPPKFCIAVADGGRFSLEDVGADIAFEARRRDGGIGFAVQIGGESIGFIEIDEVAETALTLAAAFCSLRTRHLTPARRMRDLIEKVGTSPIAALCPGLGRASTNEKARMDVDGRNRSGHDTVGLIVDNVFGVAAPFGSLGVEQLALLSDLAERHAEGELRLTTWRAILMPAIVPGEVDRVEAECTRAGLVTNPSDPRRYVEACAGAPACITASVKTRTIAAALAPLLGPDDTLHVSGCAKGCASSAKASITLVGRDGRFDLVRNGKATDTPVLCDLLLEQARIAVGRIATEELAHV